MGGHVRRVRILGRGGLHLVHLLLHHVLVRLLLLLRRRLLLLLHLHLQLIVVVMFHVVAKVESVHLLPNLGLAAGIIPKLLFVVLLFALLLFILLLSDLIVVAFQHLLLLLLLLLAAKSESATVEPAAVWRLGHLLLIFITVAVDIVTLCPRAQNFGARLD